ncbi:MAG: hypothetical protein WC584_01445 [Candidatus Pacearchaeota archaeon]
MGWFEKKESKERRTSSIPELPNLPEFPSLPELPNLNYKRDLKEIHQLPSLPNNYFGNKFSQNAIKDAVSGDEEDEGVFNADEFEDEERTMQKPLENKIFPIRRKSLTREIKAGEIPEEFEAAASKVRKAEPIFVRIDKFEEALHLFEKTSSRILEIEKMLRDIKRIRDEEEKELEAWENEVQLIKQEIEKIDKDIFSKIE